MPVFARVKEHVLVLTADGDYTPGELARVGARALGESDDLSPQPVLLDLGGAAGLENKSPESLTAEGAAIAEHRDRISKLAVVVATRFAEHFDAGGPFAQAVGVAVRPCPSHAEAMAWLAGDGATGD